MARLGIGQGWTSDVKLQTFLSACELTVHARPVCELLRFSMTSAEPNDTLGSPRASSPLLVRSPSKKLAPDSRQPAAMWSSALSAALTWHASALSSAEDTVGA